MGMVSRLRQRSNKDQSKKGGDELSKTLPWLFDAPLFIDEVQIEAMYDAILRPTVEGQTVTLNDSVQKDFKLSGGIDLGVALPWVGKAGVKAGAEGGRSRMQGSETTARIITNPYRHLLLLVIHYSTAFPSRLTFEKVPHLADHTCRLIDGDFIDDVPRSLVMLELGPGAKLVPTAVEVDGHVSLILDKFGEEIAESGQKPPVYPGSGAQQTQRDEFWKWYDDNFDDRVALSVLESAVEQHHLSWIDFNVPLMDDGSVLHLNLRARGLYNTGTFGYNFIRRGLRHGLRIVGTLKKEPDLNVLAVFER